MNPTSSIPLSAPIQIRKSLKATRLRLQINAEGNVILVAPWFVTDRQAHVFASRHQHWILKHLGKIEAKKSLRPALRHQTGDTYFYFGEPLTLNIQPSAQKRPVLRIRGNQMVVRLYRGISRSEGVTQLRHSIRQFYRKKAEETIRDRLDHFNQHYGFRYRRVAFRDQKSRWGSCSRAGNLNFSWRLVMAPIEVIDFVVVHELCHLKEMNHSHRFWALVEQMVPDHKKARKWLRENHRLLAL